MKVKPELLIPFAPPSKVRLGNAFDGGYAVCPSFLEDRLISLGCDNKSSFERAYFSLRPNSKADIYDPNNVCILAEADTRAKFHNKAIQSFDELDLSTPCVIQMDIEGGEKDLILNYEGGFENVTQLIIEFHFKMKGKPVKNGWNECLEKLNEHFHLIHIHGNTNAHINYHSPIPNVIECTYVNKEAWCPAEIESKPFPDLGVDRSNKRARKQHYLDWWII